MKKLFSMAAIFIVALTLVACTTDEADKGIDLKFTFTDEYGVSSSETVTYDQGYEGSFKELLIANFDIDYSDSDFGTFLNGIEHLNPKKGAYVAISKNEVSSEVGIDLIEFEDDDSFELIVVWWDLLQKNIDDMIQLFLADHASDYVNSESIEYNVLLALNLLNVESDYVSMSEVENIVDGLTLTYVSDYFKAIMMLNSVESDTNSLINELNLIVTPGTYGQTAYGLLALDSVTNTADYASFITDAIADLNTNTPFDSGLDTGGISLVALSNYTNLNTLITDYTSWISESLLDTGGVNTRDSVWGETTYPGTENASSMSQIILGLVANGIDPTGVNFTSGTNNLITRLLEFGTDTGSFDYVLTDELTEDLAFSTPQAFLALVVYQQYANTNQAVNPYNFK